MAFLSQSRDERNYPPQPGQKFYFERMGSSERFFFDESAGEDIPVYIVDTGANLEHPVSIYQLGNTRNLAPPFNAHES